MSARGSPAGEGGAISQLAKSLNLNDGIGEVGSWAAIMQDEQMNAPLIIEEETETQQTILEGEDATDSYRNRRPALSFDPPYVVHVRNLPEQTHEEDLFFHFGGETSVLDIWIRHRDADVELLSDDSMIKALQLDKSPFFGRILEVVIGDDYTPKRRSYRRDSQSSHFSTDSRRTDRYSGRDSGGRYGGEHQGGSYRDRDREMMPPPTGYPSKRGGGGYYGKERGGGYNEQYGGGGRGGRSYDNYQSGGYTNNNHPASYRGGGGNRGHQGHPRGGQGNHPDSSRDGYQNQNKYNSFDDRDRPGSIRRSGSHQFEQRYDRPGSVARSHTDERDRRSVDAPPAPVQPPVKKPTSRDIFGDAKPVDTRQKELEIEEKLRKEKELLKQQAEAERLARNEAAQAAAMAAETHSHPPSKMHSPHYDRSTHSHAPPPVHYERKTSSPFDGSPGSVTIIKRMSLTKDDDASPPLDPVHPTPVMPEKKSIQQTNEQIGKPSEEQKGDGNKVVRTFTRSSGPVPSVPNPLQKSQTVASIGVDGSSQRGGGYDGRGRGRGSVRGRGGSSRGGVSHPIGERRGSNDGTHKTKQGGIQKQYHPERKESLTSVRGGASERGGRGGKRSVGERTQSQQDVHSGGKTNKDEERKVSLGGHIKAEDGVSSHHREDRLKKSASEDRPAPPKDDSKTGISAEKRNSVGGGEEKKKGKGGEVGSRKKEKEEKKKLQSMPKLQTGAVTSVLSQNKFALLMDE